MSLVLIADNDSAVRGQLKKALERAGHEIVEAATAHEVMNLARKKEPDLLLLDISLSGADTLDLLEELRCDNTLARLPIMVTAGDADNNLLTQTYRWDIVDFLHKPLDMDVLAAKIGAHTRLSQAHKFSNRLSKEVFANRIDRLETVIRMTDDELTEAERHFTWMQPRTPKVEGYRIDVKFRPYGKLGGDFYDFLWLDHNRLAIMVGDISGHGIQAAILQTMSRKLINLALRQEGGALSNVISFANRELAGDLPPGSFVAVMIGILDTATHAWKHVRCGVPYPILVSGGKCHNIETPGGPLGLSKKPDWHVGVAEYATVLEPKQTMLMISDGIIEIFVDDKRSRHFDVEGVVSAIEEAPEDPQMLARICERAQLESRADDDATLISITRLV